MQEALDQERHKLSVVCASQEGEEAALQDEITALTQRNNELQFLLTTAEQDRRHAAEEIEAAQSRMEEERAGWQLKQQQHMQEAGHLRTQLRLLEEQVHSLEMRCVFVCVMESEGESEGESESKRKRKCETERKTETEMHSHTDCWRARANKKAGMPRG